MDYNDFNSAYNDIIKNARQSVERIFNEAKQKAYQEITDKWYSYEPTMYNRLNLMLNSLMVDVNVNGDTIIARLYIRDSMHPSSNSWNRKPISFEDLYGWFANGKHPSGQQEDILKYTNEDMFESGKVAKMLQSYMREKGFDIT